MPLRNQCCLPRFSRLDRSKKVLSVYVVFFFRVGCDCVNRIDKRLNVEVEGDSWAVISALKDKELCLASYGDIIMDIQLLACSFQRVSYCHVCREGNNAAHVLARKVVDIHSDFLVWLENVPSFLEHVIQSDFSHV
jgi:hypothetical protein